MKSPRYAVYEHFLAFQGEGVHTGRTAYFIRLHGCDQSCPWCDSAGTWHPGYKPDHLFKGEADQVAELIKAPTGTFVVLTGGEPTLYDLEPLCSAIHQRGFLVHLETAGHHPLPANVDWVTLSPKPFATPPLETSLDRANEFKIIVTDETSLNDALKTIKTRKKPIWLHPEWSHRQDPFTLELICEQVTNNPAFRAGYQVHKLYGVDRRDPNTDVRSIPLGGDPRNGPSD